MTPEPRAKVIVPKWPNCRCSKDLLPYGWETNGILYAGGGPSRVNICGCDTESWYAAHRRRVEAAYAAAQEAKRAAQVAEINRVLGRIDEMGIEH